MADVLRDRPYKGLGIFAAGFRPFFLLAGAWATFAIPIWLCAYAGEIVLPSALPPVVWHVHEMIFGFAFASVAGFLLTAIPNWTGRLPLRGWPLAALALLWLTGRIGVLFSGMFGALPAAVADLSFPLVFLVVVAIELIAGRNWRNLPMLVALSLFLLGNVLVHMHVLGITYTAELGNRIGLGTLLMLIALVGGRIVPSFTRNWLSKAQPNASPPAQTGVVDIVCLVGAVSGIAAWVVQPAGPVSPWIELAGGLAVAVRLSRWRGLATVREPLLFVMHVGYGWLALGLLLLGVNGLYPVLPPTVALHALTVGAIGTMTLAVMTRASLGHSGRQLSADTGTIAIYVLVTFAAILRLAVPFAGTQGLLLTGAAGAAWSAAFGLFLLLYGGLLMRPNRGPNGPMIQIKPKSK